MLCAIRQRDQKKVSAWHESKVNRPFYCPQCGDEAILKQGSIKVPHFAHKPPILCEYGRGETEHHRQCKLAIYEGLSKHSRFREVALERSLGTVRPDVSAWMDGIPIAIEVQISTLTMDQIIHRTEEYCSKGIHVLWLALHHAGLESNRYSPRLWERWVHAAYFGRVYYWLGGLDVVPYHFGEFIEFVESLGYKKLYKRFKRLSQGKLINLANDFTPTHRIEPWRSKTLIVPECRLLLDRQPIWWKK
jgi:competence protein CoiA